MTQMVPEFIQLMAEGSISRKELSVNAPPTRVKAKENQSLTANQRKTRWHVLTFKTAEDANEWTKLVRTYVHMGKMRAQMKKEDHPQYLAVKNAYITLDEVNGKLVLEPIETAFTSLLQKHNVASPKPQLERDPIADFDEDEDTFPKLIGE